MHSKSNVDGLVAPALIIWAVFCKAVDNDRVGPLRCLLCESYSLPRKT